MIPETSLCGCLLDVSLENFSQFLHTPGVDLLEWRIDTSIDRHSLSSPLKALSILSLSRERHPVIATNRSRSEGGAFEGPEALRVEVLQRAVEAGAEWVDLEERVPDASLEWFHSRGARVLLSHHDFSGTPDRSILEQLVSSMAQREADALKVVTHAQTPEDNLRVLELIPFAKREFEMDMIAFCMGPLGRWSRLACLLLGSPWSYVQLPGQPLAAPGQIMLDQMRTLLELAR